MKIKGTPEEIKQAKDWWTKQKNRIDEEYKQAKKKDPKAKKDDSLVSIESKERRYRRNEVSFSKIQGKNSENYLDSYLEKHSSSNDDLHKQIDDELTANKSPPIVPSDDKIGCVQSIYWCFI